MRGFETGVRGLGLRLEGLGVRLSADEERWEIARAAPSHRRLRWRQPIGFSKARTAES